MGCFLFNNTACPGVSDEVEQYHPAAEGAALACCGSLGGSHRRSGGVQGQPAADEEGKPCDSKGEPRWQPVLSLGIHYMPACPEKGDKEDMCKRFAVLLTFKVVNQ